MLLLLLQHGHEAAAQLRAPMPMALADTNSQQQQQWQPKTVAGQHQWHQLNQVWPASLPTTDGSSKVNSGRRLDGAIGDTDRRFARQAVDGRSSAQPEAPVPSTNHIANQTTEAAGGGRLTSSATNLDSKMAQFISEHLRERPNFEFSERQKAMSKELDKAYRWLRFVSKVAHKLQPPPKSDGQVDSRSDDDKQPAALSRANEPAFIAPTGNELARRTGAQLVTATSRKDSKFSVASRLAKKTDWNALFVKLAKVFLQYFLDLILNDMFGTTGKWTVKEIVAGRQVA